MDRLIETENTKSCAYFYEVNMESIYCMYYAEVCLAVHKFHPRNY
jgi:hypothetical protein